jgi:hypothetical protein
MGIQPRKLVAFANILRQGVKDLRVFTVAVNNAGELRLVSAIAVSEPRFKSGLKVG